MELLITNWYIIIALTAVVILIGALVYKFAGLPTKEQITKIKEWLLYAVTKAEMELGSGTGVIKLRTVYDAFITKFPIVAKLISFQTFSKWVDDALDEMKKLLAENEHVKDVISHK